MQNEQQTNEAQGQDTQEKPKRRRKTKAEQLASYEAKIADLKAKREKEQARIRQMQNKIRADERKKDTHAKIVIGAWLLATMKNKNAVTVDGEEMPLITVIERLGGLPLEQKTKDWITDWLKTDQRPQKATESPQTNETKESGTEAQAKQNERPESPQNAQNNKPEQNAWLQKQQEEKAKKDAEIQALLNGTAEPEQRTPEQQKRIDDYKSRQAQRAQVTVTAGKPATIPERPIPSARP